jgi:hypothetical protein
MWSWILWAKAKGRSFRLETVCKMQCCAVQVICLFALVPHAHCHFWMSQLCYLCSLLTGRVCCMCWGQITCMPIQTPTHYCSESEFYHWKGVNDLNIEFKLIDVNWFSECLAVSFCWWILASCPLPVTSKENPENMSDRVANHTCKPLDHCFKWNYVVVCV